MPPLRNGGGGPTPEAASHTTYTHNTGNHHEAGSSHSNGVGCRRCPDTVSTYRRRLASQRMVRLDCGCRDPLGCLCDRPPLSDGQVDGYKDAVEHLRDLGLTPAAFLPELRVLWRRGDREFAVSVCEGWGLAG